MMKFSSLGRFSLLLLVTCYLLLGNVFPVLAQDRTSEPNREQSADQAPNATPNNQQSDNGPWYLPTFKQFQQKVDSGDQTEIFGERYTLAQVGWIVNSLLYMLIYSKETGDYLNQVMNCVNNNSSPNNPDSAQECIDGLPRTGLNNTLLNLAFLTDQMLIFKPASGVSYFLNTAKDIRLISEAKAQTGFGFQTLRPTLKLWQVTRNISYSFLIIGIIAIAFMIMFRVKINPQTVISIQSALPRIILSIILITFSYAIAGLIVDFTYVINGVVALSLDISDVSFASWDVIFNKMNEPAAGFILTYILQSLIGIVTPLIGATAGHGFFLGVGNIPIVSNLLGFIAGPIFNFFLFFGLLVILIRVFWLLLRTYIISLILVVSSPFFVIFGAINPQSGYFGGWLKQFVANIAVFPIVSILMVLSHIFFWGFGGIFGKGPFGDLVGGIPWFNPFRIHNDLFVDPVVFPSFSGSDLGDTANLGILAGIAILFMIPGLANAIRNAILTGRFGYQSDIGVSFAPAKEFTASVVSGTGTHLITRGIGAGGTVGYGRKTLLAALEGLVRAIVHK